VTKVYTVKDLLVFWDYHRKFAYTNVSEFKINLILSRRSRRHDFNCQHKKKTYQIIFFKKINKKKRDLGSMNKNLVEVFV
jgi:hypothetical protein